MNFDHILDCKESLLSICLSKLCDINLKGIDRLPRELRTKVIEMNDYKFTCLLISCIPIDITFLREMLKIGNERIILLVIKKFTFKCSYNDALYISMELLHYNKKYLLACISYNKKMYSDISYINKSIRLMEYSTYKLNFIDALDKGKDYFIKKAYGNEQILALIDIIDWSKYL